MEWNPPTPKVREQRLYQADFLIRRYGFDFSEIVLDDKGNLPLDTDPKTAWARHHLDLFPVEVNAAEPEELLRVPGIGPRTAWRILEMRSKGKLKSVTDLKLAGVSLKRVAPFLLVEGKKVNQYDRQLTYNLSNGAANH
jgi:predicted DNA-binding helix-hairpin-helix protein